MSSKGEYRARKDVRLTEDQMRKKHKQEDGDAYLFDVEYEKLKKEREEAREEMEKAREEFMRVSEQLRQEMINGTASDTAVARFMSALTDRGVQLEQQQEKLQENISKVSEKVADVENRMNELRMRAFGGNTRAWVSAKKDEDYKGFKTDSKYGKAKIVEMTPEEYLRRVAFDVKGGGLKDMLSKMSPATVERYMRNMLRGTRYGAPSLNFKNGSSSGDERALAALLNGYKRIPVMVIE